jgi:predicted Holliday junction resolvase-like endonuclease
MSKFIKKVFGAIVGVLLLFLGIERRKNQKQKETIVEQKQQIAHEQRQAQANKVAHEIAIKGAEQKQIFQEKQEQKDAKIEKAQTNEEVISIANTIVDEFNTRHKLPNSPGY